MLSDRDYKKLHYLIQIAYIAVFALIAYFAFRYIFGAIMPFIVAFIVASLVDLPVRRMNEKLRVPRSLASAICVLTVFVLLAIAGWLISSTIWGEIKTLISNVPGYLQKIITYLQNLVDEGNHRFAFLPQGALQSAYDYLAKLDYSELLTGSLGSLVLGYAGNVVTSIPSILISLIVTIVSSIFMSGSFPRVKSFILRQFKETHQELIMEIQKNLFSTLGKYLRSYLLLMLITFFELLVFFLIFNFKPAVSLALLIAVVDILPVLGVGTVLIPWALFSLLSGAPWRALILICMYVIITIVRQILEPKVIGDHVGMLPILTLFCIWIGLKLFGFGGMFLVPITVVIIKNLHDSGKIRIWHIIEPKGTEQ